MPALPFPFSDLFPLPAPSAPEPLVNTLCPTCGGGSYVETSDDSAALCGDCGGAGHLFVCPKCGLEPDADTDLCGCTPMCENCGNFEAVQDSICAICYGATLNRILEEEDPGLQAYYQLRDFDLPRSVIEQEMAIAQREGWL